MFVGHPICQMVSNQLGGGREECSSANGPLQSGECKKAAAESKRRGEGGDRKSGKMKLYSSGIAVTGEKKLRKNCSVFDIYICKRAHF